MKNIAIIPARSGSKGLKDKNIKLLNGKPMIAYTIEAAIKSEQFDKIVVSTDSPEYAEVARKYGASVPFFRNASLSSDVASSWDVVRDVLHHYRTENNYYETITLLQPTSPFREADNIIQAYELYKKMKANAVISVCEIEQSPLWSNTLPEDKSLNNFIPKEVSKLPRQKLPVHYRLNGALYIVSTEYIINKKNIYDESSYAYIMPEFNSIDIDSLDDFKYAEYLLHSKSYEKE